MTAASLALFNPGLPLGERVGFRATTTITHSPMSAKKDRETRGCQCAGANVRAEGQRQDGGNDDDDDDEQEEEAISEQIEGWTVLFGRTWGEAW